MSWAARRRLIYLTGVFLFFAIVVGGPVAYHFLTIAPTCHDGIQNQGETAVDEGGPCLMLNPADLQPEGILWTRAFLVRQGVTDAVAYVDNPNQQAGVLQVPYEMDVYDDQNALIEDVGGTTFIMPGGVTPVFVGNINTGNRIPKYAQFKFTGPLTWERAIDPAPTIKITNEQTSISTGSSQLSALATNSSVSDISNITFVATVFDPAGNAIATSQTALQGIAAGASAQIYFTWPSAFSASIGSIDIIPLVQPQPDPAAQS
ncbi:MAG TPA: hypothetical protein VG102_01970 [Candidatus Paceibacterota bacterium]|jgi:hypothetical protein|nr:hypothetical protein [Candidatus Paceibacterota bacterium]